jgi:hypothetical protein
LYSDGSFDEETLDARVVLLSLPSSDDSDSSSAMVRRPLDICTVDEPVACTGAVVADVF